MTPEIFVVDDNAEIRAAIARILRDEGLQPVLFESELAMFRETALPLPSCILVADEMPVLGGAQMQAVLDLAGWRVPIVLMSAASTVEKVVRAIRAGAVGFLSKPVDPHLLLAAVREAVELNERNQRKAANQDILLGRFCGLTVREREVVEHVMTGRLNKQIGGSLGVTEKTIKVHRARAMQKLGVRTVPDLIRLAKMAGSLAPVSRPSRPATWDWNIEHDWVMGDAPLKKLYGIEDPGGPLRAFLERIHPDDVLQVDASIRHAIASGDSYQARFRVLGDHNERCVVAYGRVSYNERNVPVRFPGIILDT